MILPKEFPCWCFRVENLSILIDHAIVLIWQIKNIFWRRWGRMQTRQCYWDLYDCFQMLVMCYNLANLKKQQTSTPCNGENPTEFWSKMNSVFHKSKNLEHKGFLAERLIATMDRFCLEIEPYEEWNLKHPMRIYVNCGVSGFYQTLYWHEKTTLYCSYYVSGTFRLEIDVHLLWQNSQCQKHVGYLWFCKEKFKDGLPKIEEMHQSVYLR